MSVIGPGTLGAINLAGSLAGGMRTSGAEADRLKESAAQRNTDANVKALASQSLEDIGQTDQSADRDGDGRMPMGYDDGEAAAELGDFDRDETASRPRSTRVEDADGVLGNRLDLEA